MQEENHLHLSSREPTYWPSDPNKLPDLLDFFITKGTSAHYAEIVSNLDLTSDHTPVIGTNSTTVVYRSPKPSLYNKHTDWGMFKENVRKNLKPDVRLKTEREIDEATNEFITIIQRAVRAASPIPTKTIRQNVNIPQEILRLVREKRRARAKWHRTQNPVDKNL